MLCCIKVILNSASELSFLSRITYYWNCSIDPSIWRSSRFSFPHHRSDMLYSWSLCKILITSMDDHLKHAIVISTFLFAAAYCLHLSCCQRKKRIQLLSLASLQLGSAKSPVMKCPDAASVPYWGVMYFSRHSPFGRVSFFL